VACNESVLEVANTPPYDAHIPQDVTPWTGECRDVLCDDAGAPLSAITHGPMIGAITDRSVKIWVRSSLEGELLVNVWPTSEPSEAWCSKTVPTVQELDHTAVAILSDLRPATSYTYQISFKPFGEACAASSAERWTFRTLPEAGQPARIRFVVGADVEDGDVPGFADIRATAPDFVLMIGDNVYADADGFVEDYDATFERYQRLYHAVWGGRQFRDLFSRTASFMIWDDHEIMENYWAGKSDLRYAVARNLYDSYQHAHNPAPIREGELYYSFTAADIGFFVLDTRSHRDGNMEEDDVDKTMLGAEQRQAFEEWLADKTHRVHVIVSSVIFSQSTTTGADPWRSFSVERDALLAVLADNLTPNTFIVSGDQHWSAVLKFTHNDLDERYSLYEFQTTPLGSGERDAPNNANENITGLDNKHQVFGVFDIDTRQDPPLLDFTMCAVGRPCEPHTEPPPESIDVDTASLPYTLFFEGGANGFEMLDGQR